TSGSISYFRLRRIDYSTGLVLAPATIPGAVIGALVVGAIPRAAFDIVMGGALVLVAGFLLLKPSGNIPVGLVARFAVSRTLTDSDGNRYSYRFNLGLALAASFGIGFVSSLLGIGGGIIQVPILTTFFAFPAHIASATAQFVQVATAGVGALTHVFHGDYAGFVGLTVALAVGVIVGAQVGAAVTLAATGELSARNQASFDRQQIHDGFVVQSEVDTGDTSRRAILRLLDSVGLSSAWNNPQMLQLRLERALAIHPETIVETVDPLGREIVGVVGHGAAADSVS